jgi:hypothetical protein
MGTSPLEGRSTPKFRDLRNVEVHFSQTVQSFLNNHDERIRPLATRIVHAWCRAWGSSPAQFPSELAALAEEIPKWHWQVSYRLDREHRLQRQRQNYRKRREALGLPARKRLKS